MSEVLSAILGVLLGLLIGYGLRKWGSTPPTPCSRAHLPSVDSPLLVRTKELVTQQEAEGGNGELKRHRAYARLIKDFPDLSRRQLAVAIEVAHEALPRWQ